MKKEEGKSQNGDEVKKTAKHQPKVVEFIEPGRRKKKAQQPTSVSVECML